MVISPETEHKDHFLLVATMPQFLYLFKCIFFIFFSLVCNSAAEESPTVLTSTGPVKGVRVHSGTVTAYLGIPYAEPPVGKLRFQKPLPHKPWHQVLEATRFGNSCPQLIMTGVPDAATFRPNTPLSEDCLFLNVWVPHPLPTRPIPVLVWIYGGSFFSGTASLDIYNGASFAATQEVMLVSLNYRLGILGFVSLPPAVPGNMGLLDQQLALQWVNNNAAAFGGDPNRVTIFGQSAGAGSVSLHLLSPNSQPLFSQAVVESGAPNAIWAWRSAKVAKERSIFFGQQLGCSQDDPSAVVKCLQTKDASEFTRLEQSLILTSKNILELPVYPTTDGDFLPDDPQKLLKEKRFQVKKVIIGVTSDEGSGPVVLHFSHANFSQFTQEEMLQGIRNALPNATEEAVDALAQKYIKESHGTRIYFNALSQIIGDYFFVCPVAEFAAILTEAGSPVYVYSFTHHTSGSPWPEWMGAQHGAEVPYVFGTLETAVAVNKTFTEAEAALSRRMMGYWAEFARSGKPTGSAATGAEWPVFDVTQQNFFQLSTDPPRVLPVSPSRHCASFKGL